MSYVSDQIRVALSDRGMTQVQLAGAVQRSPSRISELLKSLDEGAPKQDRLSLLLDIASRFDLELLLAPRDRVGDVLALMDMTPTPRSPASSVPSLFDEVFINLGAEYDNDEEDPD